MENQKNYLLETLLSVNSQLTEEKAREWVDFLWEDFESTQARAGRTYKGEEVTGQIVEKWIRQYGPHLHRYEATNEKFFGIN